MKGESPGRNDVDYDEDGYDLETPLSQVFFFDISRKMTNVFLW